MPSSRRQDLTRNRADNQKMSYRTFAPLALALAAAASAGCGHGSAGRAQGAATGEPASSPVPISTFVAADDRNAQIRTLQRELQQAQAERDAALAQLREAQAEQRELEARLASLATPVPQTHAAAHSASVQPATRVFHSITTAPQPSP